MKIALLIVSLVVNVALVVAVARQGKDASGPSSQATTPRTKVLTRTVIQEVDAPVETNSVQNVSAEPFHWNSIQSTNFVEYARKLREMGCPNQTVRDIITGEINDWTLAQRRVLMTPYANRFWEFAAKGDDMDLPKELEQPLKELKKKRQEMLQAALKDVPKTNEPLKAAPKKDESLAMLPEEKINQIKALEKKYAALRLEIGKNKDSTDVDGRRRHRELDYQEKAEKEALMSPEELTEYKLRRESWQFQDLYGFTTNEEEMRKIAWTYVKHNSLINDSKPAITAEERAAIAKARDEEVKAMLGEARFAELKRGADNSYRMLWQVAQAYDLPERATHKAYEIQVASREQFKAIQQNAELSNEQKTAMIQELQDEVEDATVAVLGEKAAGAVQRLLPNHR